MKSLFIFASLLSLSLQDICQNPLNNFRQLPDFCIQSLSDANDFSSRQSSFLSNVSLQQKFSKKNNEELNMLIVIKKTNLHNHHFRNQLVFNFNTTMLRKLRKSYPAQVTTLNNL